MNRPKPPARSRRLFLPLLIAGVLPRLLPAAVVGTNTPAQPLSATRVATLPPAIRGDWETYLRRSGRQLEADRAFLQAELRRQHLQQSSPPPPSRGVRSIPLDQPAAWYSGAEACRIADNIVSFQTPAGGWSKNLDVSLHPRAPGEHFAPDNSSRFLGSNDNDVAGDVAWHYVGTFDNDATVSELRYLAKVVTALSAKAPAAYRQAFLRGLDFILAAQYPNGGWPQVWPLEGGYHDAITYNDDAMVNVLRLLREVSESRPEYGFVPAKARRHAALAVKRGHQCVLDTQVVAGGRRTIWCQQHDPLTLQPASARNYEMPSLASAESAQLMRFLMELPKPDAATVAAVHAAAAWFRQTAIPDVDYRDPDGNGRRLVHAAGSGPLWARYYDLVTQRPIFGERDKTIHDTVDEISKERRNGYGWYRDTPREALTLYADWAKAHPQ